MKHKRFRPPARQKGVILLITLMAMVILLISSIALLRSFDTSLLLSGSMAFKRDLVNQGERGITQAITDFNSGVLSADSARQADLKSVNYSATILSSNSHGIPQVLLGTAKFTAAGMSGSDITDSSTGVTIRTVIDRQCSVSGEFSTSTCVTVPGYSDSGGTNWLKKAGAEYVPVYRISVRVDGPRNTQVFLQTTLAR
jgi:type IV pilus assembly protein PilX